MQSTHEVLLLSVSDTRAIEEIHAFWIGEPAREPDALIAKFQRWFQGGETIDRLIEKRFGHLVTDALDGKLDHWRASLRGRLALIILLDQFTRNLFRNTPRAYAGDRDALTLALEVIDTGGWRFGACEQRMVFTMPLVHSEDIAMQSLVVPLVREIAEEAPRALRAPLEIGCTRTEHYRSIIARFGRFPHRNTILGRTSTAEERVFLEEEAKRPAPLPPR
jgi:uncharacterized protein (DUF924 family)